jgi:TonB family protein
MKENIFMTIRRMGGCWMGLATLVVVCRAQPSSSTPVVDGPAYLREWTPPEYPPQKLKEKAGATVMVRMIVDASGHVTTARALTGGDPEFIDAALAAVRKWKFDPATEGGKAVANCLEGPVEFSPEAAKRKPKPGGMPPQEQRPHPSPSTPVQEKFDPPGDYPAVLKDRMLPAIVRFHSGVGADGRPVAPRIVAASHVEFVLPALATMERWEFTPAMQGDLPVASEVDGQITFDSVLIKPDEILAANAITAPDGTAPPVAVEPRVVADPVWPIDALLSGEGGSATAEFTVTETGFVTGVRVREATKPVFGQALAAALETWLFSRPFDRNGGVTVPLLKRAEFKAIPVNATEDLGNDDPVTRLVLEMRKGAIGGAKGLDERLMPIYRVAPQYPAALKAVGAQPGKAEIEFVIDRDGRARLPRIVSASREEFGWAAATAVAQWVFKPPQRKGAAVDVKVRIPFDFKPPAS